MKSGVFPKEVSKLIKEASENRENADCLDFFIVPKDELQNLNTIKYKTVYYFLKQCILLRKYMNRDAQFL